MTGYTMYSRTAGVEIMATAKTHAGRREGNVTLRFFTFTPGEGNLNFILSTQEAFSISRAMNKIVQDGGRHAVMHKYASNGTEIITNLILEKWTRDNRVGFALAIKRGEKSINVATDETGFLYVGELLRALSTEQAYVETAVE
jgi:hypothetical protein